MRKWSNILMIMTVIALMNTMAQGYVYSDYEWKTYNGHQYALTLDFGTWEQAEAEAVAVGGHLVTINDAGENEWITEFIKDVCVQGCPDCSTCTGSNLAWIGYRNFGGWGWVSGEPVTYTNFLNQYNGIYVYIHGSNHPTSPGAWNNNPTHYSTEIDFTLGIIEIPEQEPLTGRIAFTSDRDGNLNIYMMNIDGNNQTRLTNHIGLDICPVFSPDGQKIAFFSNRIGSWRIYIMDCNGHQLQDVPNTECNPGGWPGAGRALAWSPDGLKLLFKPTSDSLATINVDGSDRTILLTGGVGGHEYIQGVEWGPTMDDVYFNAQPPSWGYDQHIFHYSISGNTWTQITQDVAPQISQGPKVSSDGTRIAYHRQLGWNPPKNIFIMDLDGSNKSQITFDEGSITTSVDPDWTGESGEIVFWSNKSGSAQIWLMDSAGGNLRMLEGEGNNYTPSWTPIPETDAGMVAYWSFDDALDPGHDDSGNENNGTVYGAEPTDGICENALSFDGSGSYVAVPSSSNLSFNSPLEAFSTSLWIKPDTIIPLEQIILENEDDYIVSLREGGGLGYFKTDSGNLYHNCWHSTNPEIPAGNWSHIAVTYDGSGSGGTKMYVNGEEKPVTNTSYHGGGSASGNDFAIGIRAFDFATQPYGGEMDDVRIYDRALSECEIKELATPCESPCVVIDYEFVSEWGGYGSDNGQFNLPHFIDVDSSGHVYVADYHNNRVQKFTSEGGFVKAWGNEGVGEGQLTNPSGIAVDTSGHVYVTDYGNHSILKFTNDGTYIIQWGGPGGGDSQFAGPYAVAIDSLGFVYVTDHGNHRVQKFTSDGTFVKKWGGLGNSDGQFNGPAGITVDSSGYVYVCDLGNHRIQKFTGDGDFDTKWGNLGSGDGEFNIPCGIGIDPTGYILVVESLNNRIQKFTDDGTFVMKWGSEGTGNGQFFHPMDIAFNSSGNVYVSDYGNNRIQKFEGICEPAEEQCWQEQQKLLASDGAGGDMFGVSVSIDGEYAIVGADGDDDKASWAGAAYIFKLEDGQWVQKDKLTASDGAYHDRFGLSVSIDGEYAIVGAWNANPDGKTWAGAAYIFRREGETWTQQAKLTASDGAAYDDFGTVSIKGSYAIVGSKWDDLEGVADVGSAYIYERPPSGWVDMTETAKLTPSDGQSGDLFGCAVSIYDDYAVVGACRHDTDGLYNSGSAYIFDKPSTGWVDMTETTKLTSQNPAAHGSFGGGVSISGDYLLIGESGDDSFSVLGAAYVFKRDGETWIQQAKLTASDGSIGDIFGNNVQIKDKYAVISAPCDDGDTGSAYVFKRDGETWTQQCKLTASDRETGDRFAPCAITDGYIIVGAGANDDNGSLTGSAYIFENVCNTEPTADAGGPYIEEASSWLGASVDLDGSASSDPDGDALTYEWDLDLSVDSDGDGEPANDVDATEPILNSIFPIGQTQISLVVVDECGARSEPDITTVTVTVIEVGIEIRSDDGTDTINLDSGGVVRIAFLTDEDFDALTVDPLTVTLRGLDFADGLVKFRGKNESVPMVVDQDYDGDGDIDRVVNLDTERLAEEELVAYCEIGALTYDGLVVLGVDIAHLAPVAAENSEE